MIVGHNPSMHEISEYISGSFIDKFSTCGLSWIAISDEWHQIKQGCGELKFFLSLASFDRSREPFSVK